MIRLSEPQISKMLDQPETGMGYQTVEVEDTRGIKKRGNVYNGDILLFEQEPREYLAEGTYEKMVKAADGSEAKMIKSIRVVPAIRAAFEKRLEGVEGKPATEGQQKKTNLNDVFMRFTAYRNDRRITPEKGLRPGTYATTEADSRHVKTGEQAVERYALPDPKPAIYRYRIDPLPGTVYRQGTVQPAFDHKGGGVEVIFDNGTTDNTVSGPAILPPK